MQPIDWLRNIHWQGKHPLAQSETFLERPDQAKALETSLWVRGTPGWDMSCRALKIWWRRETETSGQGETTQWERVTEKSRSFWAGELQGKEFEEIYWLGGGHCHYGEDRERRKCRKMGDSISHHLLRTRKMDEIPGTLGQVGHVGLMPSWRRRRNPEQSKS